jgi:SAM-dependent methyltransferase
MNSPIDYAGIQELEYLENVMQPFLASKARLLSALVEGHRILEVGCGTGSLTQFLSSGGLELTAVDCSRACIAKAKQKGIKARFAVADILDDSACSRLGEFDTVVMSDVLEHINDDEKALVNARTLLSSGGVLVVTVPAFPWLYSKLDSRIGHYRRYSKRALLDRTIEIGLRPEVLRFWNVPGFIGWLVMFRLFKKGLTELHLEGVTRLYGLWLSMEQHVHFPTGLTLVLKARR